MIDVAAVTARARRVRFSAVLVAVLTGVFYVPGWLAGKLWFCIAWAGCAVAEGFTDGAGRMRDGGPAERM